MTSPSATPALAERGDIHKSCKSIETLSNILNEYCEAAGAVVSLQKKLAKALKDAATSKATAEIPSNAMLASANVFESLSDIDSKFSKIVDREYDLISNEVKKWFKKLTKEERAHDERMAAANAKIKQAGQLYEKKSKKKAADANEEHARYINLISTLGPELSQDKHNHALNISQRHTTMIYSLAACLARLADFEWQKSCECVRRFSPTIGPLGSLRSLCEGGWTGAIPPDLPDIASSSCVSTPPTEVNTRLTTIDEETRHQPASTAAMPEQTISTDQSRTPNPPIVDQFPNRTQETQIPRNLVPFPTVPRSDTLELPNTPFVDPNTGSVRSLSAFPAPPSHFPIPSQRPQQSQQSTLSQSQSSTSLLEFPATGPLAESPISAHEDLSHSENSNFDIPMQPSPARSSESAVSRTPLDSQSAAIAQNESATQRTLPLSSQISESPSRNEWQTPAHRFTSSVEIKPLNPRLYRDRNSPISREFGNLSSPTNSRTVENFKYSRPIEQTDTGTSTAGSIVATMRSRYDNNSGSTSPPPRDLPRLPLSVNNIAARYQGNETASPKLRTSSPPVSRHQSLPLLDTAARQAQESRQTTYSNSDEERRQRQQQEELAGLSRRQTEQELREQEVELEVRLRELEKDRARLQALREGGEEGSWDKGFTRGSGAPNGAGQSGLRPRERRVSIRHQLQRRLSKMDLDESDDQLPSPKSHVPSTSRALPLSPRTEGSYNLQRLAPPPSANNLHTPPSTLQHIHYPKPSHPPSPLLQSEDHLHKSHTMNRYQDDASHSQTSTNASSHASYCGCEKCSVSKYRDQGESREQQDSPTESKRSEKMKLGAAWIRRLSMPVGSSKKHQTSNSVGSILGSGIAGGSTPASKGGGLFSLDSKRNSSTTMLGVQEDGKIGRPGAAGAVAIGRRSHDLAALSNRSMTNLRLR